MDNFYNSPELFDLLLSNETDAYETLRSNKRGLPEQFSKIKLKKGQSVCWLKKGMVRADQIISSYSIMRNQ